MVYIIWKQKLGDADNQHVFPDFLPPFERAIQWWHDRKEGEYRSHACSHTSPTFSFATQTQVYSLFAGTASVSRTAVEPHYSRSGRIYWKGGLTLPPQPYIRSFLPLVGFSFNALTGK